MPSGHMLKLMIGVGNGHQRAKETKDAVARRPATESAARTLLAEIRRLSNLTLEEIAPLIGVSRRSLQNWRAHRPTSARKEQRLRGVVDTLRALPNSRGPDETRHLLLSRVEGGVRPYDLLAEARFDAAYSLMMGSPAPKSLLAQSAQEALPPIPSVLARMSIRDDDPVSPRGRVDLRRSRRLTR